MDSIGDVFLISATFVLGIYFLMKLVTAFRVAAQRTKYQKNGITAIDGLEGEDFAELLSFIFRSNGYQVKTLEDSVESGADLVVSKDGKQTAVVGMRHVKGLGWNAIQIAIDARDSLAADASLVVTNAVFTRTAQRYARENRVELWDRKRLTEMYLAAKEKVETK